MVFFMVFYIRRKQILLAADMRKWIVLVALQLIFLVSARLIIPLNSLLPYAFPLATCGIVTAALFGTELALVTSNSAFDPGLLRHAERFGNYPFLSDQQLIWSSDSRPRSPAGSFPVGWTGGRILGHGGCSGL